MQRDWSVQVWGCLPGASYTRTGRSRKGSGELLFHKYHTTGPSGLTTPNIPQEGKDGRKLLQFQQIHRINSHRYSVIPFPIHTRRCEFLFSSSHSRHTVTIPLTFPVPRHSPIEDNHLPRRNRMYMRRRLSLPRVCRAPWAHVRRARARRLFRRLPPLHR